MILPLVRATAFRSTLCLVIALLTLSAVRLAAIPAFPGAEGFGADTVGGRGGTVYHVTNLNDSGAGSFRDAVSAPGRTVVFDVGGIIVLTSPVVVRSNITVAGQTAPGDGITLYGDRLGLSGTNNIIIRYLRVREGINGDAGTDTMSADSGDHMLFDHLSVSWGRDETFSFNGSASNVTLQDCIIGQGLLVHSAGGLVQTSGGVSIFRCLYIDNWMRNPKVKGVNDYQNNVVYNWGSGGGYIPAGDSAGFSFANMIGNYFIAGLNTGSEGPFKTGNDKYSLYHAGNLQDLNVDGSFIGTTAVTNSSFPTLTIVPTPFAYPAPATLLTAPQAFAHIVANVGASLHRDSVDTNMVAELTSLGTTGVQIFNESEVGGVGVIAGGLAPVDTDGDGMPDWWESAAGTNPTTPDNNGDINSDGYTNLENYINALAPAGVPAATVDGIANDSGSVSSDGVTTDPTLVLRGKAAPGAVVTVSRVDIGAIGTTTADVSGLWTFDYTGTPLADRYYAFFATVDLGGGKVSPPTRVFVVKVDTLAAAAPVITSIVTNPSFTFNGTAEPFSFVTVTLTGTGQVGTATADGTGAWSALYTGAALPPGIYSFTAAAVDLAGNAGPASVPFVIDTSLASPVFTSITTDSGISNSDQITNDATLIFNGTAPSGSTVAITRIGTGVIGSVVATGGGTWTFNYTGTTLLAGQHSFRATATLAGNSSPASALFVVTVDNVAPTIPALERFNPTTASTTSSTLVFRVTWSEPVLNVDTTDFVLTNVGNGMTGTISSVTPVSTSVYDVTVTGAGGDGTIRLDRRANATVVDLAGNSVSTGTFTGGQSYTIRAPGSGVWINDETDGLWSDPANWDATRGGIANGSSATADFSDLNITDTRTVHLDSSRTIGRLVFADADQTSPGTWTLDNNGNAANVLTLASTGSPVIQSIYTTTTGQTNPDLAIAGEAFPAVIDVAISGTQGLTKMGWGTAILNKIGTLTGPINVNEGRLKIGTGATLTTPTLALAVSSQLIVAGGNFTVTGDTTMVSGTGVGVVVTDGTGSFQKIIPTNARNNLVKVTGGTLTATELNFPRSADAANMWTFGLVIQGGTSTIGTVGLGTVNSWGNMSVEGGEITVPGVLNVGFQQTAARGGQLRVLGGILNSTDPVNGIVLSRKNATNANNVAELTLTGGVTNAEKIMFGFDSSVNAGTATLTVNGGSLYMGGGGFVLNGVSPFLPTVSLSSGLLGAKANWSSPAFLPLTLPATGNITLKAADAAETPFDVTLNGIVSGAGGFTKTGGGTLALTAVNTFTGPVAINAGTLRLDGSTASGSALAINTGGSMGGAGVINGATTLNAGGAISPATPGTVGTLSGNSLTWNGGGKLALDVGATGVSDKLALSGALTKGSAGTFEVALNAGTGFGLGNTYTLATFASSSFASSDFSATGLPAGTAASFNLTGTSLQLKIVLPAQSYAQWVATYGLAPAQSGFTADGDADGANNLLEYYLGLNPTVSESSGLPTGKVEAGEFVFRYTHSKTATAVTAEVQTSTDLVTWSPAGVAPQLESETINQETWVIKLPMTAPRLFARLVLTTP